MRILPPFSRGENSEVVTKDHLRGPAGFDIQSFVNALPSFLLFMYSFIHEASTKCQYSHERGCSQQIESWIRTTSPPSLDKEKGARVHLILTISPNDLLSIHLFIHLLTPKLSVCFVQNLCLGIVLRRSTKKKMKNARPTAQSSWNPRGHQQCWRGGHCINKNS